MMRVVSWLALWLIVAVISRDGERPLYAQALQAAPADPPAASQEAGAEDASLPAITYRRVYVPEDRILEAVPRGFYPFRRSEFESLADLLLQEATAPSDLRGASVRRADYYAMLDPEEGLRGQAALEIVRHRPGAAAVPLAPLNIAVQAPYWRGAGAAASVGLDRDGQFMALAKNGKVLEFSWSRSLAGDAFGVLEAPLVLPPALVRVLSLDLPQSLQLEAAGGLVEEIGSQAARSEDLLQLPPADPGLRRWRVEMTGAAELTLRIAPRADGEAATVEVRQSHVYDVAPHGATVSAELRLDVLGGSINELPVTLEKGLQVISARLQDRPLSFAISEADPSHGTLRFPEPVSGSGHILRLKAHAPAILDRPWRLPKIGVPGAVWRSGQVEVRLAELLTLRGLKLAECVQTQASPAVAGKSGRTLSFRNYSADAAVTLTATHEQSRVRATAGTSVDLGPVNATMAAVFLLRAEQGRRFVVEADVAPDWIVDSVTAATLDPTPRDVLETVRIPPPDASGAPLEVRLSRSLGPDRPLRLMIRAHRRLPGEGAALTRRDLRVVELRDVDESIRYLAVEPDSPFQAALANDGDLVRLDPSNLPAEAAPVVSVSSAGIAFQDTGASRGLQASLTRATPNFSAEIAMAALVEEQTLRETYRIRVTPTSSRVEQLRVHFSHGREGDVVWKLSDAPDSTIAARRLEEEGAEEGETWELAFDRARDAPFELTAERVLAFSAPLELAFASLPQANAQKAELIVQTSPGVTVKLDAEGLDPSPAPAPSPGAYSATYGAYRYEPAQQPAARLERLTEGPDVVEAWVWRLDLQSSYPLDGHPRHLAVFEVENRGRSDLEVQLPPGAELRRLEVDGEAALRPQPERLSGRIPIPLPAGVRFLQIRMEYLDLQQRWGVAQPIEPRAPEIAAPVLSRAWSVRLPPGAAFYSAEDPALGNLPWDVRLFGPLRSRRWLWANEATAAATHGGAPGGETPELTAADGWTVHRAPWPASGAGDAFVYRSDVLGALAISLFLASAAVLSWLGSRRLGVLWLAASASGLAAILAPPPWYVFFTAVFLSTPCAAVLGFTLRRKSRELLPHQEASSTTVSLAVAARVLAGVMFIGGAAAYAQPERGVAGRAAPPPVHPVIIPIDDEGRVSTRDKYVYLPPSLHSALLRAASRLDAPPRPWLLRSASYRAAFGRRPSPTEVGLERIDAGFELEVLDAPCRIVLPLPWRDAGLAEDSVRLDGVSVDWWWDAESGGMAFDAEEAGLALLTLSLTPVVSAEKEHWRIDLDIPPAPDAELKTVYPEDADQLLLPAALGGIKRDESSGEVIAELGPASSLTMLWPQTGEAAPEDERPSHVEQLLWLHVQPDAVVVDAKWKFLGGGPVEGVEIAADDGLTLLPSTARALAGFAQSRKGGKQVLRLQWDQPRTPPFEFQASFVMQGAVGVGQPRAPRLEIRGATIAKRWLAISVDPALQINGRETREVEPIAETLFRSTWGEASAAPQSAFRLLGPDAAWSAQTSFREIPLTGRASLSVAYRRDAARLVYEANLDAGGGNLFLLQLLAPQEFTAERVSVVENGVERVGHWTQDGGELTVFLSGRVSGSHLLTIEGRVPAPRRGSHEVPMLALTGAGPLEAALRIYREPDVDLQVAQPEGWTEVAGAGLGEHRPDWGRLAAAFNTTVEQLAAPPPAAVEVAPNLPRTERRLVATTLTPREEAWIVTSELNFQVARGVLDVLRLEAPQRMAGPFTVDPPGRLESREAPHLGRRILTFRPDQPLTGRVRVRLSGFLRPAPGESLRAPDVEPLDLGETAQFFVLPLQWQGQPIAWEPYGMRADVLPPALAQSNPAAPHAVYRVVNKPRYGAVVRQVEQLVGDPQIRLVDVRAVLEDEEHFFATATIDLEPAGLQACTLRLSPETTLIHAGLEGLAATPVRRGPREFVFDLRGERLPVRLSVVYSGRVEHGDDGALAVPAPVLADIPVERTLATVQSLAPGLRVAADAAQQISPARQDLLRLRSLANLVDLTSDVEADHSPEELTRWYLPWRGRWSDLQSRVAPAIAGDQAEPLLAAFDEEQDALAERYGVDPATDAEAPETFAPAIVGEAAALAAVQGAAPAITLIAEPAENASPAASGLIGLLVIAASGMLLWLFRRQDPAEWLARWFAFACVLLGIGWWLWFSPAAAGLLIAGIGAVSSLGPGRKES